MSLWGASSFLAAALLSVSPAVHGPPAHPAVLPASTRAVQTVAALAPDTSVTTPPAATLGASAASPLSQVGGTTWRTTVLLTGVTGACPTQRGTYSLATTSPALVLKPQAAAQLVRGDAAHPKAHSCEVTLTFTSARLRQVPATATLVVAGTAAVTLTVSRTVSLFYFLGLPAIFGAVLALVLLALCMLFTLVCNRNGDRQWPFRFPARARPSWNKDFWQHPIYASGAWTLNDSWATNVVAAVALVGTVLTAIPATDALFRGVALDRFAILNAVAAGVAAAAPLVFGICYARRQHHYPGVTDNATLWLPDGSRPHDVMTLADPALAVTLAPGTVVSLAADTLSGPPKGRKHKAEAPKGPARAVLSDATRVTLPRPAAALPVDRGKVGLLPAPTPAVTLPAGTQLTTADGTVAALKAGDVPALLPSGAVADLDASDWMRLQVSDPAVPGYPLPAGEIRGPGLAVSAESGAVVTVPWGATVASLAADAPPHGVHLDPGTKLDIPPGTEVNVVARSIALPGAADVLVQGTSAIYLGRRDTGAALTLPAGDITAAKDHPGADASLPFPVCIAAPAGARVTVAGVAAVELPDGTSVSAPYTACEKIATERLPFRLPQGTNSLAGTMGMVLLAAMVTMFGAGAELGILTVLTVWFSELSTAWLVIAWLVAAFVAIFALGYSVTAIRSLADPQPGSSMSSTAGTSFTL
jgi:hypothetical protein